MKSLRVIVGNMDFQSISTNMCDKDFVGFETAKLLKEKGFDGHTYAYYEDEDNPNISLYAGKAIK